MARRSCAEARARSRHATANGRVPRILAEGFAIDRFQLMIALRHRAPEKRVDQADGRRMTMWARFGDSPRRFRG